MKETEFNLIDEKWIRVMDNDCKVIEVSLTDAILNAHKYRSLSGELPTQDIAVMRLILAVLHTVFSRVDENGENIPLDNNKKNVLNRWKALWNKGNFSEKAIKDYFEKWHERFWLFHPERPFGQVAKLNSGTEYESSKLNGEISESSNKLRIFSAYSGKEKNSLNYAQAARWLLYLNSYDDTSSKPTKEGKSKAGGKLPSPGAGWLGKLGLIYLTGNNFFETLMLNFVMINQDKVQINQKPTWEYEHISDAERTEIPMPDNLAELYTVHSRRILLKREEDEVIGYKLLGGDFFQKENAFFEPMTIWRTPKNENESCVPKRHDSLKQMWREFAVLYKQEKNQRAGIIEWYENCVYGKGLIPRSFMMKTSIVSVEYGDKDFFVKNVFSDSLMMNSDILSELGKNWRNDIEKEIANCEDLAKAVGRFAQDIYIASGGSDNDTENAGDTAKSRLYYLLDMPFRRWLRSIDPDCSESDKNKKIEEWQETAQRQARHCVKEIISESPETVLIGHLIKDKDKDKIYSAPKAKNIFNNQLRKIYSNERR